ncbi:MAG: peroxiredoxin-like family protein [Promethearchaeota archaeon]|jgi:peroxiredoxin
MENKDINEGIEAPLFTLDSYNAGKINLEEFKGKKIVLIFSRYFGCPICQVDLKELINRRADIDEKGAQILYITQSGEEIAKEYIEKEQLDFPVIPSSKDELYTDYGLGVMTPEAVKEIPLKLKEVMKYGFKHGEYEGWEKQGPGQFVIDEQGKIIHAKKGWLDIESILAVL